ncbi:MAG: hypothetical protein ABI373_05985 [Flavobacteriales bacterium]
MTVRNTSIWSSALVLGLMLAACGGGGTGNTPVENTKDSLNTPPERTGLLNVGGKIFSIPSPVQTALLIQDLGLPYNNALPFATDSASRFTSKGMKALALGIYGADLAYVTIHKDGQKALKTLKTIEQLSSDLNLSHAFNKELLDGFKNNLNNEDSLLRFSGVAFRSADQYLKMDQQGDVSAAILAGGWIEGLYLTVQDSGKKVDPKIIKRLGEQGHTLNNLIALLEQNGNDATLIAALKDLASAYTAVHVTYTFEQPTLDAANKTTYINSVTKTEVAPKDLKIIIQKVKAIRISITA